MYAKSGLKVFPLWRGRKLPQTPNGYKDSSNDPDIVTAWFKSRPDAGIGIEIPKDIVVVDTDGEEARNVLLDLKMVLPHTLEALSGRNGGEHFWYRIDATKKEVGRKINVFPKVDVLVNGFVVAPPSFHENGRRYKWRDGFKPDRITAAPNWIYQLYEDHEKFASKIDPAELLKGVPEGQRNVTLFRYACRLRNTAGITLDEARILVNRVADASDYKESNVDKLVERVWQKYPGPTDEGQDEIKIWSSAELRVANLPAPKYLVHETVQGGKRGLLRGVGLLTSEPKRGKSVLAKYIAKCVATGQPVWNRFDVEQCGVLYLDFEETAESAKENLDIILKDDWPANLYWAYSWPRADKGGLTKIRKVLEEDNSIGLVVVDTLGYFWNEDGNKGHTIYHQEQRQMQEFNKLHADYGVHLLLIHHDRKSDEGTSVMKKASGSYAITGGSHTIWQLNREENSPVGTMNVTGKGRLFERQLDLLYDPPFWHLKDED